MSATGSSGTRRDVMVTSCPDCRAIVQLPSCANVEALVQCPYCGDQYPLKTMLPETIPELILVKPAQTAPQAGEAAAEPVERETFVASLLDVPATLRNGSKRSKRRSSRSESRESATAVPDPSIRKSGRQSQKGSRSRESHSWAMVVKQESRPRNPGLEMAKVVLGGMLAIPVAQVIVWWLIGLDPLNIAPSVGRVIPFVVPAKLRPEEAPGNSSLLPLPAAICRLPAATAGAGRSSC